MTAEIVPLVQPPTTEERYKCFRENAELFVQNTRTMVESLERDGKKQEASNLRVWALTPWEAMLRDDDSGDLWPVCEACGCPIKNDAEYVSGGDVDLHRACCP